MKINNTEISPADNILDLDLLEIAEKSVNALKIRVTDKETGNKWFGYLVLMTNGAGKPRVEIATEHSENMATRACKTLLLKKAKVINVK